MYMTKTHWNTSVSVENSGELPYRCASNNEAPNTGSLTKTDTNNLPFFFFF